MTEAQKDLRNVRDRMIALMDGIRDKAVDVRDGDVIARAGYTFVKSYEVALRYRLADRDN